MINRLEQFNESQYKDKLDILFYYLCDRFNALSIQEPIIMLDSFFIINDEQSTYKITNDTKMNIESTIAEIIRGLLFFQKIYGCFYIMSNQEISFKYHNEKKVLEEKIVNIQKEIISFDFDFLGYYDKYFQEVLKEIPNYSKEMSSDDERKFHIRMLKLSKKIPFNAYSYCSELITQSYFRYNEIVFLEHKGKIVQYVLDRLNEGIKNLIGSNEIMITAKFNIEDITQKKNSFLS